MLPSMSLWLSLTVSLLMIASASATTCTFTITFPNTTYPQLGELLVGTLTYNDTVDPVIGYADYGYGNDVLSISGTRTVWTATPAAPTTYSLNSTVAILNGVSPNGYAFFANNTAGFIVQQFGGQLFVGQNFTSPVIPPDTPAYFFWDQYIYPGLANPLDPSGLLLNLSAPQPGTEFVPGQGVLYTVGAYDEDPTLPADLQDDSSLSYQGPPLDVAGYGGSLKLTNCIGPASSSTAGRAFSDPRVIGFWGQDMYIEGVCGQVYSLLSDSDVQLNARIVRLEAADIHCPDSSSTYCTAHTGTYFGTLALALSGGDRLVVEAGDLDRGFASVVVNGDALATDQRFPTPSAAEEGKKGDKVDQSRSGLTVLRSSHRELVVTAGLYRLVITNMDAYVDLASVSVTCWTCMEEAKPEGLLGRTWSRHAELRVDDSEVERYRVEHGDLHGRSSVDRAWSAAQ